MDNSLRDWIFDGDPRRGRETYVARPIDSPDTDELGLPPIIGRSVEQHGGIIACGRCHQLPTGTDRTVTPGDFLSEAQSIKVPQLRNMHEKTGFFSRESKENHRGFGYTHAGAFPTLLDFLEFDRFDFGGGPQGQQRRLDVIAFVMSLSEDTHAGVGSRSRSTVPDDLRTSGFSMRSLRSPTWEASAWWYMADMREKPRASPTSGRACSRATAPVNRWTSLHFVARRLRVSS